MGNSNRSSLTFNSFCYEDNLSRSSVTPVYWDSHGISDDYRNSSICTAVLVLLLMLIGLPGNALIIVSIIQHRLYKKTTHILLLNLALSDFLVCLLVMPFTLVAGFAGGYVFGESDYTRCQVCKTTGVLLTVLTVLSMNTLALMSLDRFIFIKFPLHYNRKVTVTRVLIAMTVAWLISIAEAITPSFGFGEVTYGYSMVSCRLNLFNDIYYGLILITLNVIPFIITIVTNVWIACITRNLIETVYGAQTNLDSLTAPKQTTPRVIKRKITKKQLRVIQAFESILIATVIVWSPILLLGIVFSTVKETSVPLGLYVFVYVSVILHPVLHPLIEACFLPEIKSSVLRYLCCKSCYCKSKFSTEMKSNTTKEITASQL